MAALDPSDLADAAASRTVAGRTAWTWPFVGLTAVLASAVLAPIFYGVVAFQALDARFFALPVLQYVAFNWLANGVVTASAFGLSGRFDERLSAVFRRVLVAHGAVAFITLATRHYYSIPMSVGGAALSVVLGSAVAFLWPKVKRPRVGLLGPGHWIADDPWLDCEVLGDPAAPVRDFQFLLITWDGDPPPAWAGTLTRAMLAGKRVRHVAEFIEDARGFTAIEHFDVDHLGDASYANYRRGKRMLDVALALIAFPFAASILAMAALGVRLTMGAPVMFVQPRLGQGGRAFKMFKLRTMRAAPEGAPEGTIVATSPADARITPLGRWLRRFRIDELPQLWNVLIGDMSLVGPRPEQPVLAEDYALRTPAFAYRQLVRPGITGWAQVRAPYAANLAETRVKLGYDLFYLKHLSLGLDVQILLRTVWTLIGGGGVR